MASIDRKRYDTTTFKDIEKIATSQTNANVYCKNCGHAITMPNADRTICTWCGLWVYRTPQIEFKYKLMKKIKEK